MCANITAKIIKAEYNSKATRFKLDEDPLQIRVYLLTSMNQLKYFITI